jgi:hypothetical protein
MPVIIERDDSRDANRRILEKFGKKTRHEAPLTAGESATWRQGPFRCRMS